MRNNLTKIALAATFGIALALTFSCSDDKDEGGWLTCSQLNNLMNKCSKEQEARDNSCVAAWHDIEYCYERGKNELNKCFMDGACNGGTNINTCIGHYEDMGCDDDN